MGNIVPALFGIDPKSPEDTFSGFHDPEIRWNGWACPSFPHTAVMKIAKWLDRTSDDMADEIQIECDDTTIIVTEWSGSNREVYRITPDAQGLYPIGAFSWCWDVITQEVADALSS